MADTDLVELVRQALFAGCLVMAPVLCVGFVVGAVMVVRTRSAMRSSIHGASTTSAAAIATRRGTSPTICSWMPVAACTSPITAPTTKPTTTCRSSRSCPPSS